MCTFSNLPEVARKKNQPRPAKKRTRYLVELYSYSYMFYLLYPYIVMQVLAARLLLAVRYEPYHALVW